METQPVHRKTMRRHEHDGRVRCLTFSTFNRLPLFGHDAIKDRFADHLAAIRDRDHFDLYAWVIMPEHVHLLLWPKEQTVSASLLVLKRSFAREIVQRWRQLDAPILERLQDHQGRVRFWQRGGGYDRNVRDTDELRVKVQYIQNNPVRRGLVMAPTEWKWSSAQWYAGHRDVPVSIDQWK